MAEWVQRDRAAVSALDELRHRTADARLDQLAHQLRHSAARRWLTGRA